MNYDTTLLKDEITEAAKKAFGITFLYPWQRLVIANILDAVNEGEESAFAHQIVLLPTGAGKSFCFLVPALLLQKPTLIIYPLLSLMSDQQRRINEAGLQCVIFRGGQTAEERKEKFDSIKNGAKIIIANPEVLQNEHLLAQIAECGIQHIAIDEAHCVYEWGTTFRPSYLTLAKIIKQLKAPVVTAFTATASPVVLDKIAETLFDGKAHIVRSASDRPNIHYHVINCLNKKKEALKLALNSEKPVLIFCGTRAKAEDMSRELQDYLESYDSVKFYHAGLTREEKNNVEKWFYPKDNAYLCATIAFGMGVDKKNIRTVIHLEPSSTAEAYIQEAGRAGRDGKTSNAYLLWSMEDSETYKKYEENSRKRVMALYAESKTCRRQFLLDALGAEQTICDGCDICNTGKPAPFAYDANIALRFINSHKRLYNRNELSYKLIKEFNKIDIKIFHKSLWAHRDIETILTQLEKSGRIKTLKFPWKGKIELNKAKYCPEKKDNIL